MTDIFFIALVKIYIQITLLNLFFYKPNALQKINKYKYSMTA